jgi:hypothetical protein
MLKKLFITTIFLFSFCLSNYSQIELKVPSLPENQHTKGEKRLSVSGNVLSKSSDWAQISGGIKFQVFVSKRFSVDADFVAGNNYLHTGPGLIGIPLAIVFGKSNKENVPFNSATLFWVGIMILSLEHVSYHIPVGNSLDISPYVSLIRYKYDYTNGRNSGPGFISEQMSFAAGLQINKFFGKFFVAPYGEYNIGYEDHIPGYNFGIYCGIKLPVK